MKTAIGTGAFLTGICVAIELAHYALLPAEVPFPVNKLIAAVVLGCVVGFMVWCGERWGVR